MLGASFGVWCRGSHRWTRHLFAQETTITTQTPEDTRLIRAKAMIGELGRSRSALAGFVSGLSDEDLARQSACTEWDVSQVLSHLGSGSESALDWLQAGLAETEPPGREAMQPIWDRWNAMSRVERKDAWADWSTRFQTALEAPDDAALETFELRLSFFPAPLDAAGFVAMRLSELVLHSWDVHFAFDPAATIPTSSAEQILGRLPYMIGRTAKPDQWNHDESSIAVNGSNPAQNWTLSLGAAVTLEDGLAEGTTARMSLDCETFVRMAAGRLRDADPARINIQGPFQLAELMAVFPGF